MRTERYTYQSCNANNKPTKIAPRSVQNGDQPARLSGCVGGSCVTGRCDCDQRQGHEQQPYATGGTPRSLRRTARLHATSALW